MLIEHIYCQAAKYSGNTKTCIVVQPPAFCTDLNWLSDKVPVFYNLDKLNHHRS